MSGTIFISPEAPGLVAEIKKIATVQYAASSEQMSNTFNRVSAEAGGAFKGSTDEWVRRDQRTRQSLQDAVIALEQTVTKNMQTQRGLDNHFASSVLWG